MKEKKQDFLRAFSVKSTPNQHEKMLFQRAEKYIRKIAKIPGIKMVAICNSLSMFATNADSDIDLFIVTERKMIWFVRFFVTLIFWWNGVWRKWTDIAGNFCLSFFATEDAMDLEKIAIKNDYYLYFWVYFLKPVIDYDNSYKNFLQKNAWVEVDENQKNENESFVIIKGKSPKIFRIFYVCNSVIRFFLKRKTEANFQKMGRPFGVIISDSLLKFHDKDQRENARNAIDMGKKYEKFE